MNDQPTETEDDTCEACGAPMWPVRFALYQQESTQTLDRLSKRLDRLEQRTPEWVKRAVTLHDHFDDYTTLRVAQPQPQYGTVQLNATFKGQLISVDVNAADLLAALEAVIGGQPREGDLNA